MPFRNHCRISVLQHVGPMHVCHFPAPVSHESTPAPWFHSNPNLTDPTIFIFLVHFSPGSSWGSPLSSPCSSIWYLFLSVSIVKEFRPQHRIERHLGFVGAVTFAVRAGRGVSLYLADGAGWVNLWEWVGAPSRWHAAARVGSLFRLAFANTLLQLISGSRH